MGGGMLSAAFILLGSAKPPSSKVGASVTLGGLSVEGPPASSGTSKAKVSLFFSALGVFFIDGTGRMVFSGVISFFSASAQSGVSSFSKSLAFVTQT